MHTELASPVAGHCRKIGSRTHVAHLNPGLLECFRVRRWQGSDKGELCTSIPVYQRGGKNRIGRFLRIGCKLMQGWEKEVFSRPVIRHGALRAPTKMDEKAL